jgi:hypothetical protein
MRAVRFDHYGGVDVLDVRDVADPVAGPGRVLVAVKAAGKGICTIGGRPHSRPARAPIWPAWCGPSATA